MRPILVTGGAGYIGSHACKALAAAGFLPVAYDSLASGHERLVKWGPFERGDILDRARLDIVIARHKPVAVMHFAASAYVGESVTEPGKYYRNNVAGSLTLLEAMRAAQIRDIVFSSSCATYGIPDSVPISEDAAQSPVNPYGRSKWMVEQMLIDFAAAYGMRWMALRYFNAAGADPQGETGEDHDPETHLIPLVLEAAAGRRENITVHGADYDTPDGTCIRDYVHVSDLANAHVRAARALANGAPSSPFNLGNGQGFSVRQVIETARKVTGREIHVMFGPRRPGDPPVLVADARRALNGLGWKPVISGLEEMVKTAWGWQQGRGHNPNNK